MQNANPFVAVPNTVEKQQPDYRPDRDNMIRDWIKSLAPHEKSELYKAAQQLVKNLANKRLARRHQAYEEEGIPTNKDRAQTLFSVDLAMVLLVNIALREEIRVGTEKKK